MRYAALLLWLIVPLGIWLTITLWGPPHIVWTYRFHDNGDPYNPRAPRHYIDCTYLGWGGAITLPTRNGRCPWVRLIKRGAQ